MAPQVDSEQAALDFLARFKTILLDCDGVLWSGAELLPYIKETLELFREENKKLFFITNNGSKSRDQYQKKFKAFGIEVSKDEIIPVSYAAADYLQYEHPDVKKAFVVGSQGLCDELQEHGIHTLGGASEEYDRNFIFSEADFLKVETDPQVKAVVCGWDLNFTFSKLCTASLYLQKNPGCLFIATNEDCYDKLLDRTIPGNGCLVQCIQASVSQKPIVVGKPACWLSSRLISRYGLDPNETIMIGDRLDTDIMFGKNAGISTALVLTGCTSPDDLDELIDCSNKPDYILPSLGTLVQLMRMQDSLELIAGLEPAEKRTKVEAKL